MESSAIIKEGVSDLREYSLEAIMEIDDSNPAADSENNNRKHGGKRRSVQAGKSRENKKSGSGRPGLPLDNPDILHLNDLIRSTPGVRKSIVEQVKSAIHNGTYDVKAEKIAEKILEDYLLDDFYQS